MIRFKDTKEPWVVGQRVDGALLPSNIEEAWSDEELDLYGLERYVPEEIPARKPDPFSIPITRVQFKAVLRLNNLYDAVVAVLDSIPDPKQKVIAQTKFDESETYDRNDSLFLTLGPAVGLSEDDIDSLWLQALEIK